MKTLLEEIKSFESQVESMSNFKNDFTKRGLEIYRKYQENLPKVIQDLRNKGVDEATHPLFADAMVKYNYWK